MFKILITLSTQPYSGDGGRAAAMEIVEFASALDADHAVEKIRASSVIGLVAVKLY